MNEQHLAQARAFAHEHHGEALELLRTLTRIPAPTHHEEQRAAFVRNWMHRNGMTNAFVDEAKNVVCPLADDGQRDLVVFAAHTDVVFDDTDELPLHEQDGRLYAPGVGDDTANLVALLLAARELSRHPAWLPTDVGVLVVANSCEEGLGNLKGTRQLFATYGERIRRFYSFDLYLPQCISCAVGSYRWELVVRTQGGHSFHDFGMPNAIERLCALVGKLYALPLPTTAPTTRNVGTIQGGTTINAIAAEAKALFEVRSTSNETLLALQRELEAVVARFCAEGIEVSAELRGERPASAEGRSEALERMTAESFALIAALTGQEPDCSPASTDANIPLSLGIPANTIGAVRGALLHTRDEWVDAASVEEGLAVVMALMRAQPELDAS